VHKKSEREWRLGTLRVWYLIHKWTSLICTAFLLVLCLTGLPLIFRDEIALWLGNAIEAPPMEADAPWISVDRIVKSARARRPNEFIRAVAQDEDGPMWHVFLGLTPQAPENSTVLTIDARTGQLLNDRRPGQGLMHTVLKLHVELFAGLLGTLFLGVMGLLAIASVVSGIVVYGPFMRRLPFGTVRRAGSRRLWSLDLHNLTGIVTAMWVFMIGTTGVINTLAKPIFSYWQSTQLADMIAPWHGQPVMPPVISLQEAIDRAKAAVPEMDLRSVALPGTPNAGSHHYAVFMKGPTPLTARLLKPVLIDTQDGLVADMREMPWYMIAFRLSQPLHFGDYGGLPLKIVWTLLDLVTIAVLISGLYLWIRPQSGEEAVLSEAYREFSSQGHP
jgi:uncharacterized iron-regulated membrane protein